MPITPRQVCLEPGCPELRPCPRHARVSSRNHGGVSRQARGYDSDYLRRRRAFLGQPCALRLPGCTGIADSADHGPRGLQPACQHCNYADGAARSRRGSKTSEMTPGARTAGQPLFRPYAAGDSDR